MIWRHLTVAQRAALVIVAVLAALAASDGLLHAALAQAPFGAPRKAPEPMQTGGVIGWILAKQSEFYRAMSAAVRAAKNDGSAVWTLLGIAFAYGVFHAAGPGHGKAVISSYLIADDATWKRGALLAIVSALVQALVAIAVVGIAAVLLGATVLGAGYALSALARRPSGAAGLAIALWLVAVVLYDLALLALIVSDGGGAFTTQALPIALLANPADAFRVFNLSAASAVAAAGGIGGAANSIPLWQSAASLLIWPLAAIALATAAFRKVTP